MKLKLEHLAPYLPYQLEGYCLANIHTIVEFIKPNRIGGITKFGNHVPIADTFKGFKPLLRPLSQIQSYFEPLWDSDIDVRTYLSEEYITSFGFESIEEILEHKVEWWPVGFYTTLLKHHFDVFELIENGLATIKE